MFVMLHEIIDAEDLSKVHPYDTHSECRKILQKK